MAKSNRPDRSEADKEKAQKRRKSGGEIMPRRTKRIDKEKIEEPEENLGESDSKKREQIISDVIQFWNQGCAILKADWERANVNNELVFGNHWDTDETAKHLLSDRTPLNMPGLFAKVMTLSGWEKNNREQFECDSKGKEDELTAQIMNFVLRHIESNDDPKKYEYTKTDVFNDGAFRFCGVDEIYVETDDLGQNEIKIRQLPYNEVVFERNFSDVEMTGCTRAAHGYETFADELKIDYPDLAEEIDKIPHEYLAVEDYSKESTEDKMLTDSASPKRKRVVKIRQWRIINKVVYQVHCIKDDIVEEYLVKKEAEERIEEKKSEKRIELQKAMQDIRYAQEQLGPEVTAALSQATNAELPTEQNIEAYLAEDYILKEVPKRMVEKTVIAGNVMLEEPHVLEVDEIPLTFYFSIFAKGKILTIIDICKHLQQYFDKLFSQLDKNIGEDIKTSKAVYSELIDEDYQTLEEAMDALSSGENIAVKGIPGTGNPVQVIQRSGSAPEYFKIFELLLQLMEDSFGGRNFQGAQETGGQSGKAIQKLQAAAALIALNYMDNLRRHDMQLGRKLIKYVKKFYTHKFAVKVLGESLTEEVMQLLTEKNLYSKSLTDSGFGWVAVNDEDNPESRPLSEANLSLTINRVNVRQDEKDVEYEKLLGVKQLGYEVPVEAFLDTMNFKSTLKQKIIKANEEAQQMKMRQLAVAEKQAELDANMKVAQFTKPELNPETPGENNGTGV